MIVLVPVSDWNLVTNDVAVTDCVTRRLVHIERAAVKVVGGETVCVEAELVEAVDGRQRVRFPSGLTAWVRPVERAAAELTA